MQRIDNMACQSPHLYISTLRLRLVVIEEVLVDGVVGLLDEGVRQALQPLLERGRLLCWHLDAGENLADVCVARKSSGQRAQSARRETRENVPPPWLR